MLRILRGILDVVLLVFTLAVSSMAQNMYLNNSLTNSLEPGFDLEIRYRTAPGFDETAWIGVLPDYAAFNTVEDGKANAMQSWTVGRQGEGDLSFTIPSSPGSYWLTMYPSTMEGQYAARLRFNVRAQPGSLMIPADEFRPNDSIEIRFTNSMSATESAWIGIIPYGFASSSMSMDDSKILEAVIVGDRQSGRVTLHAPERAMRYTIRMFHSGQHGVELADTVIWVRGATASR